MFFAAMNVAIEYVNDLPIVIVNGRLDTVTAPAFDAHLGPFLATPRPRILLDLSQVGYISSAGLRSVLQLVKHTAAKGGRLGLFGAQPAIMEVIEISGFPTLVDLYPDREAALAASKVESKGA
ncbi:anti-sigma B factor antagonist [Granulicella rosea]|uniref:Anti-sigma factor antagonist n=2 Tax=Granulicella rosea TaxID=474952 RepID=A0A239KA78_9BACT|nr:anti-sigma B factor antagonist [Granulicella rosea]